MQKNWYICKKYQILHFFGLTRPFKRLVRLTHSHITSYYHAQLEFDNIQADQNRQPIRRKIEPYDRRRHTGQKR